MPVFNLAIPQAEDSSETSANFYHSYTAQKIKETPLLTATGVSTANLFSDLHNSYSFLHSL